MDFGSIGNTSTSLFSLIRSQLNSIGVAQRGGRVGASTPFTPLPKVVESGASQPSPSSSNSGSSSTTISALSVEIKLLNVSISSGASSDADQNSVRDTQIDVTRQELKLFRAEVRHSLKQELGEVWEELPSEVRGELRDLFKQFTRGVRQAFRDAREASDAGRSLDVEALSEELRAQFDRFLSDLKQTLAAAELVQAERVDTLASKLTSLFEGLIGRLAPPRPAPEPAVEPVEGPDAATPESPEATSPITSPEPSPSQPQPQPVRVPREGSLAYQTISLISISATYESFSIRA